MLLRIPDTTLKASVGKALRTNNSAERLQLVQSAIKDPKPGDVYRGHIPYEPEISDWLRTQGVKTLVIFRDPRDQTVSLTNWVMRDTQPRHDFYAKFAALGDFNARLMGAIKGIGAGRDAYHLTLEDQPNIRLMYMVFAGWLDAPNTHTLYFEDIVGDSKHKSDHVDKTVGEMLTFLGLSPEPALIHDIVSEGMNPKRTQKVFRKGRSGDWRNHYTPEHIAAFEQVAGDLLSQLGYDDR